MKEVQDNQNGNDTQVEQDGQNDNDTQVEQDGQNGNDTQVEQDGQNGNDTQVEQDGQNGTEEKKNQPSRQVDEAAADKDPRKAAPKEDLNIEDSLELSGLTKRERKKILRQRFKDDMAKMDTKGKINHFLTYNIGKLVVTAAVIVGILVTAITIYKNKRPIVLSYAVLNTPNIYNLNTDMIEDNYMDYYGFTNKQQIVSTTSVTMDLDTYDENYNKNPNAAAYTSFPISCTDNYYDVIISNKKGVECCAAKALIHPLNESLTTDLYGIMTSDEYKDRILSVANYNGDIVEFAIDISDTNFAKTFNLGYDDVYLCFPGLSEDNLLNVRRVLNFIFDLELEFNTVE